MSQGARLIHAIKQQLRQRGLTYKQVAEVLDLSEASVKRLFSSERFTLERLEQVSRMLELSLADLVALADEPRLSHLSQAQEAALVADPSLLLVAVCVVNSWTVDEIIQVYNVDLPLCVRHLAQLDRMGLIDLHPGNRVKLKVARDFDWLPGGPIRQFFRHTGQQDFVNGASDQELWFLHGMLSDAAHGQLRQRLLSLKQAFADAHQASDHLPLSGRHGSGLMVVFREWEHPTFTAMRRPVNTSA